MPNYFSFTSKFLKKSGDFASENFCHRACRPDAPHNVNRNAHPTPWYQVSTGHRKRGAPRVLISRCRRGFCWEFSGFAEWKKTRYLINLEPQTTIYKWMFGETTLSYIKIWNHPIETTIYKWLFGVPGKNEYPQANRITWQWNIPMFNRKFFKGPIPLLCQLVYQSVNRWIHRERNAAPFVPRVWWPFSIWEDFPYLTHQNHQVFPANTTFNSFNDNWIMLNPGESWDSSDS